jgi:hypothetical protein
MWLGEEPCHQKLHHLILNEYELWWSCKQVRAHYVEYHNKSTSWCSEWDEATTQRLLFECGSFVIPQEQNFGRGDGLQREIQFWKIQANGIATRRLCSQRNLADEINYAR